MGRPSLPRACGRRLDRPRTADRAVREQLSWVATRLGALTGAARTPAGHPIRPTRLANSMRPEAGRHRRLSLPLQSLPYPAFCEALAMRAGEETSIVVAVMRSSS